MKAEPLAPAFSRKSEKSRTFLSAEAIHPDLDQSVSMPRFVVLEHDSPFLHWDFMLEAGAALRTWRLLQQPILNEKVPEQIIRSFAEPMPDHRIEYLDYEGPVSRNRGSVKQWDSGMYLLLNESDHHWELRLEGTRLRGFVSILKKNNVWEFTMIPDDIKHA